MADAASPGGDQGSPRSNAREQDRHLPIANISRIMKKAVPANGKIAKDAKETIQECVSEFIGFVTSEASDKCQREKRKTINGDDLLWAMATLGFEDYLDPLKAYLSRYRELEVVLGNGVLRETPRDWVKAESHLGKAMVLRFSTLSAWLIKGHSIKALAIHILNSCCD